MSHKCGLSGCSLLEQSQVDDFCNEVCQTMEMKTLFLLPILLLSLLSSSCWGVDYYSLKERGGVYYKKFSDIPFTGKVSGTLANGEMKDGKKEGAWVLYHPNGQLSYKGSYKNGKEEGEWVSYDGRGTVNPRWTGTFKNGKKISD